MRQWTVTGSLALCIVIVAANAVSAAGEPVVMRGNAASAATYAAAHQAWLDYLPRRGCQQASLPLPSSRQIRGCWLATPLGLLQQDGDYLQAAGRQHVVRHTLGGIVIATDNPQLALHYADGTLRLLDASVTVAGDDVAHIDMSSTAVIATGLGDMFARGHITASPNGDYLAAWNSDGLLMLLDTRNGNARWLRFTDAPLNEAVSLAVDETGRYLAANGPAAQRRLFDTSACSAAAPAAVTVCNGEEINGLSVPVSGRSALELPYFVGGTLYYFIPEAGAYRLHYYRTGVGRPMRYLALGDSFASGEGAGNYLAGTDIGGGNMCHTSTNSYAYLLARPDLVTATTVACTGARSWHVTHERQYAGPATLPGTTPQLARVASALPDSITLSVIGNDIGFANKLKRCLEPDTCYASYEDRLEVLREINARLPVLRATYQAVRDAAPDHARLYVIGYPSIAYWPPGGCRSLVPLNQAEIVFANQMTNYLNNVIKQAAAASGVAYVDAEDAFAGHRLCEASAANGAIHGITRGNDTLPLPVIGNILSNATFHPTVLGHRLLADSIARQTHDLTMSMPAASTATLPDERDVMLLRAPRSGRPVRTIYYDEALATDRLERNGIWRVIYSAGQAGVQLKPFSVFEAWIHSTPHKVAVGRVDADGSISLTTAVPDSLPTGWHTLHIFTTAQDGDSVDIYKTVYIDGKDTVSITAAKATATPARLAATGIPVAYTSLTALGLITLALFIALWQGKGVRGDKLGRQPIHGNRFFQRKRSYRRPP